MALTQQQLKANDDFFKKTAQITKMYLWPDMGFLYQIDHNGNYICPTKRAYECLKVNTTKSFHSRIKRK